jgi:hypothetical protein
MVLMLYLFGLFFICMAMLWTEGFWSNTITYVNVIISGYIAVSLWEWAAGQLQEQMPSFQYVIDIVAVWLVFAIALSILRGVTGYLSKFKVRFHKLTEMIGNIVMSIMVATTFTAFAAWTLHMAPLAPDTFRGAGTNSMLGRTWSTAASLSSRGTMTGGNAFPSDGYASKYYQRRQALATLEGFRTGQ